MVESMNESMNESMVKNVVKMTVKSTLTMLLGLLATAAVHAASPEANLDVPPGRVGQRIAQWLPPPARRLPRAVLGACPPRDHRHRHARPCAQIADSVRRPAPTVADDLVGRDSCHRWRDIEPNEGVAATNYWSSLRSRGASCAEEELGELGPDRRLVDVAGVDHGRDQGAVHHSEDQLRHHSGRDPRR